MAGRIRTEVDGARRDTAREAMTVVVRLSSGTMTYAVMRKRDHPYAERHGPSGLVSDPWRVNAHRGVFRAGWTWRTLSNGVQVSNRTQEASYLGGQPRPNSKMIYRPIVEKAVELVEPKRFRFYEAALGRALR